MSWGCAVYIFDIDGMLFEYFMIFLRFLFILSHFMSSLRFVLFPNIFEKIISGGGGDTFYEFLKD